MKVWLSLFFILLASVQGSCQNEPVHILAIGSENYLSASGFISHPGPIQSARNFSNCFGRIGSKKLLLSEKSKPLSKDLMLSEISSFIDFVASVDSGKGTGIIYYCGYGMADKSGSAYLIPGNLTDRIDELSFPILQEKLFNIDIIRSLVIESQKMHSQTRFIVLADCCSDQISTEMYRGIKFSFSEDSSAAIEYNIDSIRSHPEVIYDIERSAELTFDDQRSKKATLLCFHAQWEKSLR